MTSKKSPPDLQTPSKKVWWELERIIQLPGNSSDIKKIPDRCPECKCKEFYKQSDFKRQIGLVIVGIASVSTMVLMVMGFNWFLIWTPMLLALVVDRVLFRIRPTVLICYQCKHVFRGLSAKTLEAIEAFDLVIHDRFEYKENHGA